MIQNVRRVSSGIIVDKRDQFHREAFHGWQAGAMRIRAESDASDAKRNFRVHTAQGFDNTASRLSLTP